jgi:hypothetical protein
MRAVNREWLSFLRAFSHLGKADEVGFSGTDAHLVRWPRAAEFVAISPWTP